MLPQPIPVEINCTMCGKTFRKFAAGLDMVLTTVDVFSHCDRCEARITRKGGCDRCTTMRKGVYSGEAKPLAFPLFDIPRGWKVYVPRRGIWSWICIEPKKEQPA